MCVSFLLYWEVPRFAENGKGPSLPLEYHWYHLQRMKDSLAARISLITPRSFDPSEPLELQRKLEKRWEVIGKDFAIEKVNQDQNQREAASRSEKVKLVCMSDTHSTQGEFGWSWIEKRYKFFRFSIPDGDIFVHAGDFTRQEMKLKLIVKAAADQM